jgi:two-component system cell cycle sensor histidine kinase/response regulator CckA
MSAPNHPCVVEGDPAQLQQIVMNLVLNGAEAIPHEQAGTVRVTLGVRRFEEPGDDGLPPGEYVLLQVEDTGIGMDKTTLERIFDPFFTTKFTGRGLGLAAVQGIVRGHKGTIRVVSTPGIGTVFDVLLPQSKSEPTEKKQARGDNWRGRGTILVVDDEEVVRRAATAALEHSGFSVVPAAHGRQAIELFRQAPDRYAAVLLDMTMPVMNGEEALPELRAIRPDVKVIVSSGFSEAEAATRFASHDLKAFIQKPYSGSQLAEKVRAVTNVV